MYGRGLGETCTHVAAVLFYLEAQSRLQGNEICTQCQCEWVMPTFQKSMEYLPVKDNNFSLARSKRRKLDDAICSATNSSVSSPTESSVRISNPAKIPSAD